MVLSVRRLNETDGSGPARSEPLAWTDPRQTA